MADGTGLAATLYLPDPGAGPQPCLLEALPYRKDDLTSSYAETYRRLRDEFGYAVCRVDLRGTGSSGGDATDEYPAAEQRDLVEVIAWLAEQEWCDGGVGMWGTSYSGFNSLQIACERPPALKAICAIYATDDRWTDDVHWRGGALRLVDLVDYCHYMTPMYDAAARARGVGRRLARGVAAPARDPASRGCSPGCARTATAPTGGTARSGSTPTAAATTGSSAAVMIVAGWADGYRNNSFRTVAALRRGRGAAPAARRAVGARRPDDRDARAADRPRRRDGRVVRPLAARHAAGDGSHRGRRRGLRAGLDPPRARPRPARGLLDPRRLALPRPASVDVRDARRARARSPVDPDVGTAAWIDCAGHLPWGLSGDQREDDARSLTWEWARRRARCWSASRGCGCGSAPTRPLASLSVKLCDVFPDGTSALVTRGTPRPRLPRRACTRRRRRRSCPARSTTSWSSSTPAPTSSRRASGCGSRSPAPTGPTRSPRPPRSRSPCTSGDARAAAAGRGTGRPAASYRPGADHQQRGPPGVVVDDQPRRARAGPPPARCATGRPTTCPTTGRATEQYAGEVTVDRRTFAQRARPSAASSSPGPGSRCWSARRCASTSAADGYDVSIEAQAHEDGVLVAQRRWDEYVPR